MEKETDIVFLLTFGHLVFQPIVLENTMCVRRRKRGNDSCLTARVGLSEGNCEMLQGLRDTSFLHLNNNKHFYTFLSCDVDQIFYANVSNTFENSEWSTQIITKLSFSHFAFHVIVIKCCTYKREWRTLLNRFVTFTIRNISFRFNLVQIRLCTSPTDWLKNLPITEEYIKISSHCSRTTIVSRMEM